MIVSPMKHSDFIKSLIESANDERYKAEAQEYSRRKAVQNPYYAEGLTPMSESILGIEATAKRTQDKYNTFVESLKCSLLGECFYRVISESLNPRLASDNECQTIARGLINNYINENGVNEILDKMRTKSYLLSEMHEIVTDTVKSVREGLDMSDPNSLFMTTSAKDTFMDKVNATDAEDVVEAIGDRVTAATDEFIRNNAEDKETIKSILAKTKDSTEDITGNAGIEDSEKEDIIESMNLLAKRKITDVRAKSNNIFGTMVTETAMSVMRDKEGSLKREFMSEGRINIPKIVDRVTVMYTFLEALNTMKLEKIDEAYLDKVIKSMSI